METRTTRSAHGDTRAPQNGSGSPVYIYALFDFGLAVDCEVLLARIWGEQYAPVAARALDQLYGGGDGRAMRIRRTLRGRHSFLRPNERRKHSVESFTVTHAPLGKVIAHVWAREAAAAIARACAREYGVDMIVRRPVGVVTYADFAGARRR